MKIAIGSDHAGFELKERAKNCLGSFGHEIIDYGTTGKDSVDYPDFGLKVARAVATGDVDRGVAICMTGGGMTIVCNKVRGVRAVLCLNKDMAYFARSHNDANILTLAQKYVEKNDLEEIIKTWLETEFSGGRHIQRLEKIEKAELV